MIERKLFKLLGENKKYIYYTVGLMLIGLIGNIMITASICSFIKIASSNMNSVNFKMFAVYGIIAVCGIVLRFLSTRFAGDYKELIGRNVKKELRQKVYNKIICFGVSTGDDVRIAGITQTAVEGIEQLDLYYSTYIPQLFYALLAPLFLFIISVCIYWRFAVTLLVCVPLIPMSIIAVSKYAKRIFNKYWSKYASMGDSFLDSVQGLRELKIFNADERQHMKMNETSEDFRKITMKVLVMQLGSTTIMDLVAYVGAAVGIVLAVHWCVKLGGSPYAALFLILIAVEFFLPLRAFGSAFHIAMNGVSAGNKIIELHELNDPIWGDEVVTGTDLAVDNVSFSYDSKREVLKDITIHFPSAGLTSIVGESGCGKSTIVNLLIGAYRPTHGSIEIGGKIIEHVSRHSLYAHIAVVSYNTYIFNDTVRENFLLINGGLTDDDIYTALKKVNLFDFIIEQGGLDRIIEEDAVNISGGQKQRLALAVNLAADKDIYIFDEATSNIDIESEEIIMANIRELSSVKSVILISHRLENVIASDMIYFMEAGEIKEVGTHYELMKLEGGYANLYTTQKKLEYGYLEALND